MRALACPSQPDAVSLEESAAAASAPTALYDAQAYKRMRQRATQQKSEKKTKGRGKNTIEKTAKRLLSASFGKRMNACSCLPLTAGRRQPRRVVDRIISKF